MPQFKKRNKTFLSESHEEFGSVSWYVKERGDWGSDVQSEIRITDCYKVVTLDFCAESPSDAKKRLEKLDTLITELQEARKALQECVDLRWNRKYI
ncbi:hypothetical protein vBValSX1_57 [Vibrio phage vB_ValS_X1]|uniref:Uncharacterized protein n=1 Tax=Vibrio phage vB_ValS_X1 TaxID=2736341 RepID=A0A6M9Z632_9CAUD|nr:hypothetical protein vBValSX1_57 [Vibrio phage vB_ValS_X1]